MARKPRRPGPVQAHSSTLPFNPAELMEIRVSPAQLAEMCNVTRQSVSKWVRNGWVKLGPDGLVNPKAAIRQYMDCVDPARMRVRLVKDATASIPELRARIQSLEAKAVAVEAAVRNQCEDDFARRVYAYSAAIVDRFEELQAAFASGAAHEWLDLLEAREIWRFDDDQLRELADEYEDSRETTHNPSEQCHHEDAPTAEANLGMVEAPTEPGALHHTDDDAPNAASEH